MCGVYDYPFLLKCICDSNYILYNNITFLKKSGEQCAYTIFEDYSFLCTSPKPQKFIRQIWSFMRYGAM